jgi:di/tricarboxylate transporter
MSFAMLLVAVIIFVPLLLVVLDRWRMDVAALAILLLLGLAQYAGYGVLGPEHTPSLALRALSGLSQPVIFTLIGLFILTQALTQSGFTAWLGEKIVSFGAASEPRLILLFASLAAALSLLMNNVVVGAILLPGAMEAARRARLSPSKLLIPIAFGTALGGMATYFTTANIVISDLLTAANPPQAPLGLLSFASVGGLITLCGLLYLAAVGHRLLPDRSPALEQALARRSEAELEHFYALGERLWEIRIEEKSTLAGKTLRQSGLGQELGLAVMAIWRGKRAIFAPPAEEILQTGDLLLLAGRPDRVEALTRRGCRVGRENRLIGDLGVTLCEVLLSPHASFVGKTLKQINFRRRYGFTAVALLRRGRSYRTDVGDFPLEPGDALLVVGAPERLNDLRADGEWIVLQPQISPPRGLNRRAWVSLGLFGLAIGLSLGGMPVALAVLSAALLAILLRLIPLQDIYRAIEWPVLFFIAGMYVASLAMVQSGLAPWMGQGVLSLLGHPSPLALAGSAFLLSALLTQFMGSQATAFVVGPIFLSTAIHLQINPQAIAVATAIGCSASFLTPMSHAVNMIMIGPGNYRFADFPRVGAGLFVVTFLALLLGMALFWHLA